VIPKFPNAGRYIETFAASTEVEAPPEVTAALVQEEARCELSDAETQRKRLGDGLSVDECAAAVAADAFCGTRFMVVRANVCFCFVAGLDCQIQAASDRDVFDVKVGAACITSFPIISMGDQFTAESHHGIAHFTDGVMKPQVSAFSIFVGSEQAAHCGACSGAATWAEVGVNVAFPSGTGRGNVQNPRKHSTCCETSHL
jgi:hypothetical protein